MLTVKYELFSDIDKCGDIFDIHDRAKDLATAFETIEFNIVEARDLNYIALISENQRDIFLKNINSLIEIHLRLKVNPDIGDSFQFHYREMREIFLLKDKWVGRACDCLFSSIFELFYAIDDEVPIVYYYSDNALSEITFIIKSYLAYLGKEDKLEEAIKKVKEDEGSFRKEEDIMLPLKIDGNIIVPENLILPSAIKYEVRREIDGLFYAITSEESAQELFKHRKKLVELAYNINYYIEKKFHVSENQIYPVFYHRMLHEEDDFISSTLVKITSLVRCIVKFHEYPDSQTLYVTSRQLEEIHTLAQECLEIGFFDIYYVNFSKEITDSAQLAQLIDTNIKILMPTGSRTKPAIRDD